MGRAKKKRIQRKRIKMKERISIRKKMGKPIYFTLTHCSKNLSGLSHRYNYKSNMHQLHYIGTSFNDVKYQSSIITKCSFRDTVFNGVDFYNTNLRGTSFKNAFLRYVVFYNCKLSGANFSGAKFEHVYFICTNTRDIKGLDISEHGIRVYTSYYNVPLSQKTQSVLLELSNNEMIYSTHVLHVNKNKLNHWTLQIIRDNYGIEGIEYLTQYLTTKEIHRNMNTVYSYLKILEKSSAV